MKKAFCYVTTESQAPLTNAVAMDFLRGRTWEGLLHSDKVFLFKGAVMAFVFVEHKIQIKYFEPSTCQVLDIKDANMT